MPLTAHEDCLLVCVDAQPGFYPEDLPDRGDALEVLARVAWMVSLARKLEVPVLVTEELPERNGATGIELAPDTPVLTKPTFGLAGSPEILQAVRDTGRGTAVLVGFETDVCVYQSAVGLLDAGLRVIAAEDATFSPGEMQARGLARMRDAGVALTHCKALAYEWVRSVDRLNLLPRPAPFRL
jgi:nicotinamidase-related amidase